MENSDIKRLALVYSVHASIEGMKVQNVINKLNGHPPTYGDDCFQQKSNELQRLASCSDKEL